MKRPGLKSWTVIGIGVLVTGFALSQSSNLGGPAYLAGVVQLIAGSGVSLSPTNGQGTVTVSATGSGGSVTSVGLADGSTAPFYTITNSPVTGAGTLTFTLVTQAANCVLAGPTTGAAAQPTCRALVAGDLPSIPTTLFTGALQAAQFPALTGDCTTIAAALATTCTKTNGTSFGTAATVNTGTSGATIPLLNGANTWSGVQTVTNGDLSLLGTSTGHTLLESGLTSTTNNTLTLPITATDTLAALGTAETWTAAQKFTSADLLLLGSSTGYTTLNSGLASTGNNTLTLPTTATDTLAALGTVQTFSAAQTMSAGLTLTNAANSYTQTSTGLSLTSGTTGFGRDIAGTVNDASAVDGIIDFANITCTTCTATSYLVDWQVGSSSVFKVGTGGSLTLTGLLQATNVVVTGTAVPSAGIYKPATNQLGFASNGLAAGLVDANQHWRVGANTPTITSGNCGATTNGTLASGSTDQSGEVVIGSATTSTCTVTFGLAYTTAPRAVILQAANAGAATAVSGEYISSIGTSTFVITGTLASTSWYYWVQ